MAVAEEFLEMSGIVIFIYALLSHMASQVRSVTISFERQDRRALLTDGPIPHPSEPCALHGVNRGVVKDSV